MEAFRCDHISINPITFTSSSTKVLLSLISHIHMATILLLGGGLTYLKLLCEAATMLVLYLAIFTFISSKRQSTRKHSESPVIIQRWTILAWSYFQVTCVTQSAKMGLEATSLNFNLALIWNERRRRRKKRHVWGKTWLYLRSITDKSTFYCQQFPNICMLKK